jgi:hypothetical protein
MPHVTPLGGLPAALPTVLARLPPGPKLHADVAIALIFILQCKFSFGPVIEAALPAYEGLHLLSSADGALQRAGQSNGASSEAQPETHPWVYSQISRKG